LFAIIGTTYGAGDGSTTFNLPNLSSSGVPSPVYIIKVTLSGSVEPSTVAHASSHIRAGTDVIDGDRVQIDYVPTRYVRNAAAAGAGAVTDLTAHLDGVNTLAGQGHIVCTSSTRPASPATGTMIYETDTGFIVVYNGTSWVQMMSPAAPPGWVMVSPTSVVNATNSSGNITFSGVTSVSINGCFSSQFDHYKIMFDGTAASSSGTPFRMRLRTSGTDYSGANYYFAGNWGKVNGLTGVWWAAAVGQFHIGYLWNDRCKASIEVFRPFTTSSHVIQWQSFGDDNSAQIANAVSGSELAGVARDGFTFYPDAGTFAGSIRIYGYRNSI
jgi:hypothetical protein